MSDTGATGGPAGGETGGRGGRGGRGFRGRGRGRGGSRGGRGGRGEGGRGGGRGRGGPPRPRREDVKGVSANSEDSTFPCFVTCNQLAENTRGKNLIAKVIKVISTAEKRTELFVGDATGTALVVHVGSTLAESLAQEGQWLVIQNAEVLFDRKSRKTQVLVGQFGGVKSTGDDSVKGLIPEGFGTGACAFTQVSEINPDSFGINVLVQVVGPVEEDPKPARADGSVPPPDFKIADTTGQFTLVVRSADAAAKLVTGENVVLYNCRVLMQNQTDPAGHAKMRLLVGPWSNIVTAAEIKGDNLPASFNAAEFKANTENDRSDNLFRKK